MDRTDMIFDLLKNLDEKLDDQGKSLTRVEADLKYHIRRTDLLEKTVKTRMPMPSLRQISLVIGIAGAIVTVAVKVAGIL